MTTAEPSVARRTVQVPFAGSRSGRWPLTCGQRSVFFWLPREGNGAVITLHADLPTGRTLDDVLQAVGMLVSRHEALRTVYEEGPDAERTQLVSKAGHVELVLLELGSEAASRTQITDPAELFDHAGEYPVRMAVTTDAGVPVRAIFEFSHVVADLVGVTVVLDEFVGLVASPADRTTMPPVWQPPDQAEYEQTPEARRRMARTMDYWRKQLHELPACLLSVPARRQGPPEYKLAMLRSVPVAAALQEVAKRSKVSTPSVLVSTMAALLSWWTDTDVAAVESLYSNRGVPRMQRFVGSIAQMALVPFTADPSFYETLRRTQAAIFNAYRHAYSETSVVRELDDSIGFQRGCVRHRDLVINDMSTARGGVFDGRAGAVVRGTEVESGLDATTTDPVRLTILRTEPTVVLGLTHDVRYVTTDEAAELLWSIERILMTAAERDIDLEKLGDTVGMDRVERGDGWTKLNSTWIDLATCERAFQEAAGDPTARIFVKAGPGAARSLVGYTAPADRRIGPRELHVAGVAGLDGRHGVMTPDSYIVCARTPEQPDSQAAWQAQPNRAAGSGR